MKELLLRVGSVLGKRHKKSRKERFLTFFGNQLSKMHYTVTVEAGKERKPSQHLIVGNIRTASTIFIAGYDTMTVPLVPFQKYYPLDNKKNIKNELSNYFAKAVVSVLLLIVNLLILNKIPAVAESDSWRVVVNGLVVLVIFFVIKGVAAPFNYNRNTAALVVLYQVAEEIKNDNKIAIVFGDATSQAGVGYKYISDILGDEARKKTVILLDCLAHTEKLYLVHREKESKAAERFLRYASGLEIEERIISNEAAGNSPLEYFPRGMYFTGGSLENGEIVVHKTRGFSDTEVDLERLEQIKKVIKTYITQTASIK